jgi:hypothetical protein
VLHFPPPARPRAAEVARGSLVVLALPRGEA